MQLPRAARRGVPRAHNSQFPSSLNRAGCVLFFPPPPPCSSYTLHDVVYHAGITSAALLLGGLLPFSQAAAVRGPMLGCAAAGLGAERAALAGAAVVGWSELGADSKVRVRAWAAALPGAVAVCCCMCGCLAPSRVAGEGGEQVVMRSLLLGCVQT